MKLISNYSHRTDVSPKPTTNDIFSRSKSNREGANYYTIPSHGDFLKSDYFEALFAVSNGIKGISKLDGEASSLQEASEDLASAILLPPSEDYSTIIPPEGEHAAKQIEEVTKKQFTQQFYEMYMVPVGTKDVYNRLGSIAGNITDMHSLYPNGIRGIIAADSKASWRTNLNFTFKVDEGLKNSKGEKIETKYSSLAFPPFVSHEAYNIKDLTSKILSPNSTEDVAKDASTFDMQNILYKGNEGTYRFPAFKQINDNIHLLQVLLNRCFGVESTFINEWDLSLYMQEGLLSFIEKLDSDGEKIRLPQFVTTLTYGLLDDAPVEDKGRSELDFDKATPFASLNMAVSTRYGIDNEAIGQQANTLNYVISEYPYSAYWYPWDEGIDSRVTNMSIFVDEMFSYTENGETYDTKAPNSRWFTPAVFHGKDLAASKKPFRSILKYTDCRNAVLSGWNSTDVNGEFYQKLNDITNESIRSNAFSYLPFWKQFYTNAEDGMSDLDKYIQEIYAKDSEVSFLNASYQIIGLISAGNDQFNDLIGERMNAENGVQEVLENDEAVEEATNVANKYGAEDVSDMRFSLFKCKLKIPGSKLLKMFLNKSSVTSKAMSAADKAGNIDSPEADAAAGAANSPTAALRTATPTKVLGKPTTTVVDGQEVQVDYYVPEDDDEICSKKTVGDGIAEWSPFLYGGPHGKYFSPLTLEGYTQFRNETLSNVPTVDSYYTYSGGLTNPISYIDENGQAQTQIVKGLEYSKNYKRNGSYIDAVTAVTPNERNVLLKTGQPFGLRNFKTNNWHWRRYYSNVFERENYWTAKAWRYIYETTCSTEQDSNGNYIQRCQSRLLYKLPDPAYYKTYKTYNDGAKGTYWVGDTIDYGTSVYSTRMNEQQFRNTVSSEKDWPNTEFKLIPCDGHVYGFSPRNPSGWNSETTKYYIKKDTAIFNKPTKLKDITPASQSSGGKVVTSYMAEYSHKGDLNFPVDDYGNPTPYVKYMIVPASQGANTVCGSLDRTLVPNAGNYDWLHWDTYNTAGSTWYNQLRRLYNAGTKELVVSLPIKDTRGNILNIISGVAVIEKSNSITWTQRLQSVYLHWYRRHSSWWWWGCPHRIYCWHYYYVWVRTFTDVYNMYFMPNKVKWNLPTKKLLENEARYTSQRNPDSANIIERWCTDGKDPNKRFSHIGDANDPNSPELFPFTWSYQTRYGFENRSLPLPGVVRDPHSRPANDVKTLHTSGFFYGDIMENYRSSKNVRAITAVKPSYETYQGPHEYVDTVGGPHYNLGDNIRVSRKAITNYSYSYGYWGNYYWGYYYYYYWYGWWYWWCNPGIIQLYDVAKGAKDSFLWTDYTPTYQPSAYANVNYLTRILDDAQHWPTLQVYQIGTQPYMNWYKPKDTIGVYIDTATQQIAWLKQLRDYADMYLSDSLIYEVYRKGVDNKIQKIINYNRYGDRKNGQTYKDLGGWTDSFTEDINYHDALALVERVFHHNDLSKNTIKDLTQERIDKLEALRDRANALYKVFDTDNSAMENFIELVTNTEAYLNGAVTAGVAAENSMFTPYFDKTGKHYKYRTGLFTVNTATVYNLTRNPGAILWAYLNVLYQVRKYWINLRLNKRAGSYWNLRGIERVLTFLLAEGTAEDTQMSPKKSIPQGTLDETKAKDIVFVQTRESFLDQVQNEAPVNTTETEAVYVKVNYLGNPEPMKSSKWNEETQKYNGDEIVYVPEAYRWAKKPQDGLYYIMSKAIVDTITSYSNLLKSSVNMIFAKTYKVTEDDLNQVLDLMKRTPGVDYSIIHSDKVTDFNSFETYLMALSPANKTIAEINKTAENITELSSQVCLNVAVVFTNKLLEFKKDYYLSQIQSNLYGIYIKWSPQHVWTGLSENDENGQWHIDEWQKKETLGKNRVVTDLYGYDHESKEAISAGITFDVSAAVDAGILLASPSALKDSSLLEVLCSSVDKMDLWRIEIPNDNKDSVNGSKGLHIPAALLAEKPVLVSAYEIDASINGLKTGKTTKSTKTVLAGVASNSVLPVLEPTEAMLTVNTLSALGKFDDISKTGLSVEALTGSGN